MEILLEDSLILSTHLEQYSVVGKKSVLALRQVPQFSLRVLNVPASYLPIALDEFRHLVESLLEYFLLCFGLLTTLVEYSLKDEADHTTMTRVLSIERWRI